MTRRHGAKMGALAGGIAGTMAFAALGAAAAGTLGLGSALRGAEGSIVDAIVQTANFTYAALWGMLLGGATLGALGGLLSPPETGGEKQDENAVRIAEVLSIRLLLVSLSGRQMQWKKGKGRQAYTEPALMAGLMVLLPMLELLERYDPRELREAVEAVMPGLLPKKRGGVV